MRSIPQKINQPVSSQNSKQQSQSVQSKKYETSSSTKSLSIAKNSDQSTLYVPCINCEELVSYQDIDRHSLRCTSVSRNVLAVGKSPQVFDEIDFKIHKLKQALLQLIEQVKTQELPVNQKIADQKIKYLCRATEISTAVLQVHSTGRDEERKLRDVEEELRILSQSYSGSLGIALYIERLHSLILQKLSTIRKLQNNYRQQNGGSVEPTINVHTQRTPQRSERQDSIGSSNQEGRQNQASNTLQAQLNLQFMNKTQLKNLINEKKFEVNQIKNMANMYQDRTQMTQKLLNNVMHINVEDYVNNQHISQPSQKTIQISPQQPERPGSRYAFSENIPRQAVFSRCSGSKEKQRENELGMKSEILTQISSSQQWNSDLIYQDDSRGPVGQSAMEQLQRRFYSICINQKIKLSSNHPSQKLPVAVLFKVVCDNKIPQTEWDAFVSKAFQNPQNYLDMNKVQQSQQNKYMKNNLHQMTLDQQFKNRLNQL